MEELIKKAKEIGFQSKAMMLIWRQDCSDIEDYDPFSGYLYLCELQKWLRDEHDIFIYIDRITGTYPKHGYFFIVGNSEMDGFKTYDECLEKGLIEAIDLIAKDKKKE